MIRIRAITVAMFLSLAPLLSAITQEASTPIPAFETKPVSIVIATAIGVIEGPPGRTVLDIRYALGE